MIGTGFSPWPCFTAEEVEAVSRVLSSNRVNYWTGDECRSFEHEFSQWCEVPHAVALFNGTVALDVAVKALGIGPGDEVVVAPRTFIASVSTVVNAGAFPRFADVDRNSQNITAETIGEVLTPRTRAIVCVHLGGHPCDMGPIMDLAEERGIFVIEDCAQAHGASYRGRPVGSIGHVGAWSFCQDKIITTGGEGGMVTTRDRSVWSRMWSYKDHGKSWEAVYERQHPPGFRWLHESFGTNWRMTEMQAAIGRIQLRRMPEWNAARSRNAQAIRAAAAAIPGLRVPIVEAGVQHAWYRCYLFVEPETLRAGWTRDRVMNEIQAAGVPCYSGTCSEVYLEKAFDGTGMRPERRLPVARELGDTSLMFLVHPTLTSAEIEKTCEVLRDVLARAT
ncbi:MAG: DegT/DnrJ/EryC1/StrS aminotransferase family protein [Burkholderiaceae bacterium]|nr:DegT/DnrJ/EryC1/StrS aminotransferase family protein [Burkholderiaceae bacterium]